MAEDLRKSRRRRTTLNLPADLLKAAEDELGTTSPTEAVTEALKEFVRRRAAERLLAMDLPDLTPDAVEEVRRPRGFGA